MTAHFIETLAKRHRVALLSIRASGDPGVDPLLIERCDHCEEIWEADSGRLPSAPLARGVRAGLGLLGGRPPWVTMHWTPAFADRLADFAEHWRPDIVQVEWIMMGRYLSSLGACRAPRVLTHHEPRAQAIRETPWPSTGPARRLRPLLHPLYLRAWDQFERRTVNDVQAVVVFTQRDLEALAPGAPHTVIRQIPLGVVLPERALNPLGASEPNVVFVGNFWHPPNVDAAGRLIRDIFPLVREEVPGALLYLVGPNLPADLRDAAGAGAGVVVTGQVTDVAQFLDQATVVVAPLRTGGGMRVKVLEALAAGKAVVASPLAAEGLDVRDGEELLMADSDDDFARAIVETMQDPVRRSAIAAHGRAWVAASLTWEQSVAAYERLYDELSTPFR